MYRADGNKVLSVAFDGETVVRATCDEAQKAADMLNRAGVLNDVKRQYTNAARMIYKAECLPGFAWADQIT